MLKCFTTASGHRCRMPGRRLLGAYRRRRGKCGPDLALHQLVGRASLFCYMFLLFAFGSSTSIAQNCPDPWASVQTLYGTINVKGMASVSSGGLTQTVNNSAELTPILIGAPGYCSWGIQNPIGAALSISEYVQTQVSCAPYPGTSTTTYTGQGPETPQTSLTVNLNIDPSSGTY